MPETATARFGNLAGMEPILELRRWWSETSPHVLTEPASLSKVEELERRYAISLPTDFKDYLLTSCPTGESWDRENTIWWPLDRIKSISEEYEHKVDEPHIAALAGQYLIFADYCIWCWAWAISCATDENRGKVAIIGGMPDRFVADSFSEFLQRYISNFRSVC